MLVWYGAVGNILIIFVLVLTESYMLYVSIYKLSNYDKVVTRVPF